MIIFLTLTLLLWAQKLMSGSLCNKDQLLWSWRSNISCNTVSSFVKCAWYNNYSQFVVKMIKRPCKLVQFRSVTHSCRTLCDPMNFSTPGFPGHHHLPELAQTHIHWVCDAIQPSHPLVSPLLLSSVFPSIRVFSKDPSHQVAKVIGASASASVLSVNVGRVYFL